MRGAKAPLADGNCSEHVVHAGRAGRDCVMRRETLVPQERNFALNETWSFHLLYQLVNLKPGARGKPGRQERLSLTRTKSPRGDTALASGLRASLGEDGRWELQSLCITKAQRREDVGHGHGDRDRLTGLPAATRQAGACGSRAVAGAGAHTTATTPRPGCPAGRDLTWARRGEGLVFRLFVEQMVLLGGDVKSTLKRKVEEGRTSLAPAGEEKGGLGRGAVGVQV